ncbi:hypothetical protein [Hyalangium versicolor]|uniref:hypothetical protein n=1 Tax=Hyalangium versicolor TaxID=2861190 RepID=UPI001CCDCBB3|nr:hypothetical protein [Hyalangium versicolor]
MAIAGAQADDEREWLARVPCGLQVMLEGVLTRTVEQVVECVSESLLRMSQETGVAVRGAFDIGEGPELLGDEFLGRQLHRA